MLVKRTNTASPRPTKVVPIRGYGLQLESLYARRSAVDALIQSLESYQRYRAHRQEQQRESKTA
jgi:hypothetical protein